MDVEWNRARDRVVSSFDRVADLYGRAFVDKLAGKPFDRELFRRLAGQLPADCPVLEVGAGPGQVSAFLAGLGVPVMVSDASVGQLRQARALTAAGPVFAADLARLPVRPGALGAIVAYYCLMYGPAHCLNRVFREWHRALAPGGLAAIAVHAGTGTIRATEWDGRPMDVTLVMRDPDDLVTRLGASGFAVEDRTVRPPYPDEQPTDRCYLVASAR